MTTFILTINGETKTYGYNPNEAAELRRRNSELAGQLDEIEGRYSAAKGAEKARIGKERNAVKSQRDELLAQLRECPPVPMELAESCQYWAVRSAEEAWKALDDAKAAVVKQLTDDSLCNAEYVMRYSEELIKAEFNARFYSAIGYRQLEIANGGEFGRSNEPKETDCRLASINPELFSLEVWRRVNESTKREYTRKLTTFRMPSSSSQTANLTQGLRYEAMANFLDGYYGYDEISYSLNRIEELAAVAAWLEANPAE